MTKKDLRTSFDRRKNFIKGCVGTFIAAFFMIALALAPAASTVRASDHLDTPTVIDDPAGDIGDLYAWTSSDGRRLNLVMTIVAARFSDRLQYVFHIDSGKRFGKTTASTTILCRFETPVVTECWAGAVDHLRGDAGRSAGLGGEKGRFQVFAGLRDDPFFNNVKGTRAALNVAAAALKNGTKTDAAGCADFDEATSQAILDRWRHTENGPPQNFLAGWKTAALVVSVETDAVGAGGDLLAVWAATYRTPAGNAARGTVPARPALGPPVERIGRALTANMLVGPLDADETSDRRKETYNRAARADWPQFAADIERSLGFFDAYDRSCGNQWLADRRTKPARYKNLAKILADDRVWIDRRAAACTRYLAVELANLDKTGASAGDCGGRTPNYNANAVFRSLLVRGTENGLDDGLERDDRVHSTDVFPFLAPPAAEKDKSYAFNAPFETSDADIITGRSRRTTRGSIAVANLDHLIAQPATDAQVADLLLGRARFLGDYESLDRAVAGTENRFASNADILRRARARAAVHRFAEALEDLERAAAAGANRDEIVELRASIFVAAGREREAIPGLEKELARRPSLSLRIALANAYAAAGRFERADRLYVTALAELETSAPFPYAWIYFARGVMWTEQAADPVRGEAMYRRALEYLPEFAAVNVHLAELEADRGAPDAALVRLERVAASTNEPEAIALLGDLRVRTGDAERGKSEIGRARQRFETLLARHPLAFADHAAEFYLGPGRDPERAWQLARRNLANRETRASFDLAIRAAGASGRADERCVLLQKARARFRALFKPCALREESD